MFGTTPNQQEQLGSRRMLRSPVENATLKTQRLLVNGAAWLLLLAIMAGHSDALEYNGAQLSNCYDMKYGFESQLNSSAPTQLLMSNMSRAFGDPQQQLLRQTAQRGMMPGMSVPGWQCCCWNSTNQDEVECRCEGDALTRVPQTLSVPVQRLTITSAGLPRLRSTGLKVYAASLLDIVLTDVQQLECIEDGAFASLKLLRTIYISHAPKLTFLAKDVFEGISDTIKMIRIINSGLTTIPDFVHLPPNNILQMMDLDNNHINKIGKKSLKIKTDQLILANNDISYIDYAAFHGSQIAKLTLKENRNLREVHPSAFSGMSMTELDLSSTSLVRLPSVGLDDIEVLRIENTETLKTIPSIYTFKNLQKAYLTHSFHCCAFKFPSRHDPVRHAERMKEIEKWQHKCTKAETDNANALNDKFRTMQLAAANPRRATDDIVYSRLQNSHLVVSDDENATETTVEWDTDTDESEDNEYFVQEHEYASDSLEIGIFHEQITLNPDENQLDEYCGNFTFRKHDIECYPIPNALNPCEDVMGYQWLRISVWIVVALAVVGNVAVLMVILSIKSETASVPRFLMCHLAFADLCLGLYLLLIASIDAHSMGEYFNYAYDWQYGIGCKVAGFLTVFASHLSVFTLTVITIERWLAITHAMYLNKRIKLRPAAFIMGGGWIYSMLMSMFPLFGISNYSSTSICLPMENRDPYDTVYLVSILGLNGAAFFIIAICYAQIYLSLGHETRHARNAHPGDMSIAKKMALLVFTNFSCWAPIAFFGLTALAGYPLINVTKSKILLVFFYPLNSCADPYLYAILTSQYRQDLFLLLSKFGMCKQSALKYKDSISIPGTTQFTMPNSSIHRHSSLGSKTLQKQLPEAQFMLKNEDFV